MNGVYKGEKRNYDSYIFFQREISRPLDAALNILGVAPVSSAILLHVIKE